MKCNLTVDRGNTMAKLTLWHRDTGKVVRHLMVRDLNHAVVREFCEGHSIVAAIFSSVNKGGDEAFVMGGITPRITVLGGNTALPLQIEYGTPDTLGADRIAAAVGAASLPQSAGRSILIADIGTAVTYDVVTADRRYLGGNIAPGIHMRLAALHNMTARLPLVQPHSPAIPIGNSTAEALNSGAVLGVVAELEYYRRSLPDAITVITGGGAPLILNSIEFDHIYDENLVSLGLNVILNNLETTTSQI